MSFDLETLYELLPAVYRVRDTVNGEPLKALLSVLAGQLQVLEEDNEQLYDDQFIETCAGWVIPYIGDAIGYRPLHGTVPRVQTPRAEVADTIALRRHKGTAAMLEVLAREVTGWDARVVEFFQLLATTQYLNHLRPQNMRPDLRRWEPLEALGTAFEALAHSTDVRSIALRRGRFNIPNIGIFLWRLGAYPHTRVQAFVLDSERFLFSPLGNSARLFTRPEPLGAINEFTVRAGRLNLPMPVGRRTADAFLDEYYGPGLSFEVYENGVPIDRSRVGICDLSNLRDGAGLPLAGWAHVPPNPEVAIDPVLGRLAFATAPEGDVEVVYHYGFSAAMGGGEYDRRESVARWRPPDDVPVVFQAGVTEDPAIIAAAPDPSVLHPSITSALTAWDAFTASNGPGFGVICVMDSRTYPDSLAVEVPEGFTLAIVAADWPIDAVAIQRQPGRFSPTNRWPLVSGSVEVLGTAPVASEAPGTLILDGLRISGALDVADGHLGRLALHHTTVVPWTTLGVEGLGLPTPTARVSNLDGQCSVEAFDCLLGSLRSRSETAVLIENSILDSTAESNVAFAGPDGVGAGGSLTIRNSTVVGKVHTRAMELASNTIFLARLAAVDPDWTSPVRSERRQSGCVRFSYVPEGSRVPRRYRCQPDLALKDLADRLQLESVHDLPAAERQILTIRLVPIFSSLRYGDPAYGQLDSRNAPEIREGANDQSEMGAFHDLFAPHGERNLAVRLDEYLRFGLEAGLIYET